MTIKITNYTGAPFHGWRRITSKKVGSGAQGNIRWVYAEPCGNGLTRIDVSTKDEVGQLLPPPADPVEWAGGMLTCNGFPMQFDIQPSGMAWKITARSREGGFEVKLWLLWYPDSPGYMTGECVITKVSQESQSVRIAFGDAITIVPGMTGDYVAKPGEPWAMGQARAFEVYFLWPRHMLPNDWMDLGALLNSTLSAQDDEVPLYPTGNPRLHTAANSRSWFANYWPGARNRLFTWDAGPIGVASLGKQTGAQEDQMFPGAEIRDLPGCEHVRYAAALGQARRPCHFYEADGSIVDPRNHPQLVYWEGRPHWHHGVSPDRLGLPDIGAEQVPGSWWGPDREHWLINTMIVAARTTGSYALQHLLEHQAMLFLGQETVTPGWSTSHSDAARSVGYAGLVAAYLWSTLDNRSLADEVRQRWMGRMGIYRTELANKPGNVWDPRPDNRILQDLQANRYQQGVMWWQQSLGAYGLLIAGTMFGSSDAQQMAFDAAKSVFDHAWRKVGSQWIFWDNTGYTDGSPLSDAEMVEGVGAHRTGWFDYSWAVPGMHVLAHAPGPTPEWVECYQQISANGGPWVPPQ